MILLLFDSTHGRLEKLCIFDTFCRDSLLVIFLWTGPKYFKYSHDPGTVLRAHNHNNNNQ